MEHELNDSSLGKVPCGENLYELYLIHHKSHMIWTEPILRRQKPATNHLTSYLAILPYVFWLSYLWIVTSLVCYLFS
jgi:hypothetical protein